MQFHTLKQYGGDEWEKTGPVTKDGRFNLIPGRVLEPNIQAGDFFSGPSFTLNLIGTVKGFIVLNERAYMATRRQ